MVVLANTGVGKSTFLNMLALGESAQGPDAAPFLTSASTEACTSVCCLKEMKTFWDEKIRVVDTPGLNEAKKADERHMTGLVDFLKNEV